MQQALHILQKDIRYLYREIILVWSLAVAFVWIGYADTLLIANAAFLIGRLVHAEVIPGNRQFWITRPYRWRSLLGAKLAFILIFVNLPVALSQLAIVWIDGFPLAARLPGLLWSQALLTLCVWFPIAALAAITSSTLVFIFNSLGLLALGFLGAQALSGRLTGPWPAGVEWIRASVAALALAGCALAIFYLQYKDRRTAISRAFAVSVAAVGLAVYASLPWRTAFHAQSWLARAQSEAASIQVAFNPNAPLYLQRMNAGRGETSALHVSLGVRGIPAGDEVRFDVTTVALRSPDGQSWKGQTFSMLGASGTGGTAPFEAVLPLDRAVTDAALRRPAAIHVTAHLTLFGRTRQATATLQDKPVNVTEGLQCFRDRFSVVYCRSAFRWPDALVYARLSDTVLSPINSLISYAPFPAELSLNPIDLHWGAGPPMRKPDLTLVVKEPIAYFERELDTTTEPQSQPGVPLSGIWFLKAPQRSP